MDTATKIGADVTKTASERVVQKPAEATGDLTGNKIDDKQLQQVKQNIKEKKMKQKFTYHQKKDSKLQMI